MDQISTNRKREWFLALAAEAAACTLCPAMCERTAVLSELNGPVDARVMFIGEAPGRKGADRTRIPFSGDSIGKELRTLSGFDRPNARRDLHYQRGAVQSAQTIRRQPQAQRG